MGRFLQNVGGTLRQAFKFIQSNVGFLIGWERRLLLEDMLHRDFALLEVTQSGARRGKTITLRDYSILTEDRVQGVVGLMRKNIRYERIDTDELEIPIVSAPRNL